MRVTGLIAIFLRFRPWALGGAALLALLAGGPVRADHGGVTAVRAICSTDPGWCRLAAAEYQRLTGARVDQVQLSTREALARLRAERGAPRTDVWWGGTGTPYLVAAEENLLEPYRPIYVGDLHAWSQQLYALTGDRVGGLYSSAFGIGVNHELLRAKNLPPPKCWADLVRPEYRGLIVAPDPGKSGTAYVILSGLVQQMGEDAAFAYLKQLHANVAIYAERGLEVPQALVQGKAAIGVGFLFGFETARQKGAPLAAIMPCEGSSYEVGGIALVRGRPHGESGQRYYDWLLGPAGQASASRADSLQVPANASYRRDERIPGYAEAPMRPYDFARYGQSSERQRLLTRWTNEVQGRPR